MLTMLNYLLLFSLALASPNNINSLFLQAFSPESAGLDCFFGGIEMNVYDRILEKRCSKCNEWKSLKEYYKCKRDKVGYRSECILCSKKKGSDSRCRTKLKTNGLFIVYHSMRARCLNNKNKRYQRYGCRGITIYEEWLKDPKAFYKWAKDNGHKPGLQIDRIDNDGNYCPDNCRFVTPAVNMQNSSNAKLNKESVLEIRKKLENGETPKEVAKIYNISRMTIYQIRKRQTWKNII